MANRHTARRANRGVVIDPLAAWLIVLLQKWLAASDTHLSRDDTYCRPIERASPLVPERVSGPDWRRSAPRRIYPVTDVEWASLHGARSQLAWCVLHLGWTAHSDWAAVESAVAEGVNATGRWIHIAPCGTIFDATAEQLRKSRAQTTRAGSLLLRLPPLRQIFLRQRRSGRLGLHHDARHSPAAGFFDRLNAVDAARNWLAVAVQRVAAP